MRSFRSLLLKRIATRLPGLSVLRLRLHRHLAEVDSVSRHSHSFGQLLCYLSTGGTLELGRECHDVAAGTLAWIPAGRAHSFREHPSRRPLCLAIDLRMSPQPPLKVTTLNHSEAARIRHRISELGRLKDPASIESRFLASASALAILDVEFRALGLLPREAAPVPAIIQKFQSLAANPSLFHLGIEALCDRLGQNPDYLNRLFKRQTGLTLRQQRDASRIEHCKKALMRGGPIGRAAEESGFEDSNYFSRWFRIQTGMTPSAFVGLRPAKDSKK